GDGGGASGDLIMDVAGNLYGTANATDTESGVVFEFTAAGTYKVLHTFSHSEGATPIGLSYVRAGIPYDGTSPLYGMTLRRGAYDGGVVYQFTPGRPAWRIRILHNFCAEARCADGKFPWAKLLPVSSRLLYGTTNEGGANSDGVVFALQNKEAAWSETVLHHF